jgi:hypothetical protein
MTIKGQKINDYSIVDVSGNVEMFWETRLDYDIDGNLIFQGWNRQPNAPEDQETWFIVKYHYDEVATEDVPVWRELPSDGVKFKYAWDDREEIFSEEVEP